MIDKIKDVLFNFAEEIISDMDALSMGTLHAKVQKLHEITTVYHFLSQGGKQDKFNWEDQELQLGKILDELSLKEKTLSSSDSRNIEDSIEIPTVMDSIKNLVTEIPEPHETNTVFQHLDELPTFVKKDVRIEKKETIISSETKNLNDRFNKGLKIGLNDRLAFIKNLFNDSQLEYQRVLSQLVTFNDFSEAASFVQNIVKPEYDLWVGKEIYEERLLKILESFFNAPS